MPFCEVGHSTGLNEMTKLETILQFIKIVFGVYFIIITFLIWQKI